MAKETIYVVQTWVAGKRGQLFAEPPIPLTFENASRNRILLASLDK